MSYTPAPRRWISHPAPREADVAALAEFPALIARLLWLRGVRTPEAAQAFLYPTWESRHDPFLLKDMDRAVERVRQAITQRQKVAVYGDFDTDGVTAVTLLVQLFRALDVDVSPYIPLREGEGYGLNSTAVEALHHDGAKLLITVDCGISNATEIAHAHEIGLDVIVLDHHQPPDVLPAAVAVVDPKRHDCPYPFKGLCGVGLAFKLFEALWQVGVRPPSLRARDLLDVVALGTIADMMPLTGENRVLVRYGLQAMNLSKRPGIVALCRVSGIEPDTISGEKVSFRLAPRINAAGRLEDARMAYHLLLADDAATAHRYAERLNATNVERQALTRAIQDAAREQVLTTGQQTQRIMVVMGDNFHHGVVGLAAGKLVEEFSRPALVMGCDETVCRGSARSVAGFNIVEALKSCSDLFVKYGGHAAAAGFTLDIAKVPELQHRLQSYANQHLDESMLAPSLTIDSEARFSELTWEAYECLDAMEPFGQENPEPRLLSRHVKVVDARAVGNESQHLKLRLEQDGILLSGISFNHGALLAQFPRGTFIDIVYALSVNVWNNQRSLDLKIKDLRLSGTS